MAAGPGIVTGGGVSDLGHLIFWWVNTMPGNVKNAMHGTYRALRPKYLQRYLSEFCYRFNRRFDLAALVRRLIIAAARTPVAELSPRNVARRDMGNQDGLYAELGLRRRSLSKFFTFSIIREGGKIATN